MRTAVRYGARHPETRGPRHHVSPRPFPLMAVAPGAELS